VLAWVGGGTAPDELDELEVLPTCDGGAPLPLLVGALPLAASAVALDGALLPELGLCGAGALPAVLLLTALPPLELPPVGAADCATGLPPPSPADVVPDMLPPRVASIPPAILPPVDPSTCSANAVLP